MFGFWVAAVSDLEVKPFAELRTRYERRTDRDFEESRPDNVSTVLNRLRLGADLKYGEYLSGRLQYRYAHEWIWSADRNYSKERSDVDQAYLAYKRDGREVRLGRQPIAKGSQLLLSSSNWGNLAYSWDGLRYSDAEWDVFVGENGVDATAAHSSKWIAYGAYVSKLGETMALWHQREAAVDDVRFWTLHHAYKGDVAGLAIDGEAAVQLGESEGKDVEAWAGRLRATHKMPNKATVYAEGYVASGGSSPDKVLTFDNIAGSVHALFGATDMQGWRNVTGLTLGVTYKPTDKLDLGLEYHRFGLYDAKDGWYGSGGGLNRGRVSFLDPTGSNGRDAGQEVDVTANYKLDENLSFHAGLGVFFPGDFVKGLSGDDQPQVWLGFGVVGKM